MVSLRVVFAIAIAMIFTSPIDAEQMPLVRLPDHVNGRVTVYHGGAQGVAGRRPLSLGGWLVLNGGQFLREEFPELARHLDFDSYRQGIEVDYESELVTLPDYPHEIIDDEIVEGMAICPIPECRVGRLLPFRLGADPL
ncbi:hypothetical protein [Bradyrhizobium sp. LHD-71]|uniref:hypothetical protein n=1 Tax=Bradyrhizobium sp. LHD-71 TaxID=3072141 RepID=UPI00280F7811|nr:hypothetical protein [Bradyrhizobium sp. LHD-71]MDQ8727342.1 hypothetical protein [Bradyrhizobium sp. LHD-71]